MKRKGKVFIAWLGLVAALCAGAPAPAQEIVGSLSNFDVINNERDRKFDDFELQLQGRIDPDCISSWFPGWGAEPTVRERTPFGPGLTIRWADADDPIGPGRSEHFGLAFKCDWPSTARGFWSQRGRPVREIPLPWQSWRLEDSVVWDVIRLPEGLDVRRVLVEREWVTLPRTIPLERLNWDQVTRIVERSGAEWRRDRRPVPVSMGSETVLRIPVDREDRAVLVRYVVRTREGMVARFLNQAILSWAGLGAICPSNLPAPQIQITGTEDYTGSDGNPYTRYRVSVTNRAAYPDALFAAAPDLPPCGANANSSRTWVELRDGNGAWTYGFCALSDNEDLASLWFARPRGTPPPECISVTLKDRRCEQSYESQCEPTTGFGPTCIDFEDPPLNANFSVGQSFVDSGATMTVDDFQWGNGNWTNGGHARIRNTGQAGHAGQEVNTNNVNLDFTFPLQPDALFLHFGEYGGNLNLEVNGDFQNFANFADLNGGVVGGAQVSVTSGFGNDTGTLKLSGEINSFSIGGQELSIDHVCITESPGVEAEGTWVMPYGVGGTRLDRIKPTGLLDYNQGGLSLVDAPFGGRLGFRLGRANVIPTAGIYYYRFLHKPEGGATWTDFDETVRVHYVKEAPATPPVFPTLVLGPLNVGGKKLYRFQPHEAELPSLVPVAAGETVSWPGSGFLGDIYRGFLNTVSESLTPGRHQIRLEIYNQAGTQVMPGGGTFRFVVPTGVGPGNEIQTAFAPPASISGGGFEFTLHVDNRRTQAQIDEPKIGPSGAGACGFLRYDPLHPPLAPPVEIGFHATHPDNRAVFTFRIVRGNLTVGLASVSGAEVAAPSAGAPGVFGTAYVGDGFGNFDRSFSRGELLGACIEAAFSQNLRVYAKATNGWSRLSGLDSGDIYAFALTPITP